MDKQTVQLKNNTQLIDQLGRPMHDLRISLIDRCNFRCAYCMPKDQPAQFMPKEDWLTFKQIKRLVQIFIALGVDKIRLTGGEPLLRPDCLDLIRDLAVMDSIKDLALTTNGSLLQKNIPTLKEAGLRRLTVSLDTLDSLIAQKLNGVHMNPQEIVQGILEAQRVGFEEVKVNTVIQKGVNEDDVLPLIETFRGTGVVLRFIEYMDVGTTNQWSQTQVVSSKELYQKISREYRLTSLSPNYIGEVANRYAFEDGAGEIGFISSVTQPFCRDCSRARLSADGKLYTCLFASEGVSLKGVLKASEEEIKALISAIWQKRKDQYSQDRFSGLPNQKDKIEMYKIGG